MWPNTNKKKQKIIRREKNQKQSKQKEEKHVAKKTRTK